MYHVPLVEGSVVFDADITLRVARTFPTRWYVQVHPRLPPSVWNTPTHPLRNRGRNMHTPLNTRSASTIYSESTHIYIYTQVLPTRIMHGVEDRVHTSDVDISVGLPERALPLAPSHPSHVHMLYKHAGVRGCTRREVCRLPGGHAVLMAGAYPPPCWCRALCARLYHSF